MCVGRSTASHGGPESKPAGFGGLSKEARTQEHSRLAGDSTAWRRSRPKLHTCLYRSLFRSGPKPIHPSTHPVCTLGGANCYESHGIGPFRVNGCNGLDATIDRGAGINLRGLGRQPVEDAPSGASSANTFIRRQCTHLEPDLAREQLGKLPVFPVRQGYVGCTLVSGSASLRSSIERRAREKRVGTA